MLRATRTEIHLPNLAHNIAVVRRFLRPGTKLLAVVKANAYGHGLEEVARYAVSHGADFLGVAIAEEGIRLRKAGIDAPVLILGASLDTHIDCILEYDLTPTVFSIHTLEMLQRAAAHCGGTCRFHFKVDTGMNRIGFVDEKAFEAALVRLKDCPNLRFEGMFTHFAVSELDRMAIAPSCTLPTAGARWICRISSTTWCAPASRFTVITRSATRSAA